MPKSHDKVHRSRAEIAQFYGTQVSPQKSGESDIAYYRRLAKQADTRLLRLEQLAEKHEKDFEGVKSFAYRAAMKDIQILTGNRDATRFNVVTKKTKTGEVNKALLHAKLNAVKRFLESPTSMKSKIIEVYMERAKTINEDSGTNFTWQEIARIRESAAYETLRDKYKDSNLVLKAIWQQKVKMMPERMQKSLDQNLRVSDDKVVSTIEKAMAAEQLTLKDFGI